MTTSSKKTLRIVTASGETVQVECTSMVEDGRTVRLFDGDDLVARFDNASSVYPA